MKSIIGIKNIKKSYKEKVVLKDISFNVKNGEILCVLGPNGAGKSTTINILTTALNYDSGEIKYNGEIISSNNKMFKRDLGVVPQDIAIYEDISAEKNVKFFASLYGLRGKDLENKVNEALEFVGLSDKKKDKPKTFSGGMKRRLNIACAIAHNPKLIIMDEPTVGIDPQSRKHILESIKKLRSRGATIIYTTHYMEEVEEISSRIIIMDHGEIIAEGTKEELKESIEGEKIYFIEVSDTSTIKTDEIFKIEGVRDIEIDKNIIKISTLKGVDNLDKLISFMIDSGLKINNLTSVPESLEMVFLKLTGRSLRD
ncbi:ABC transporter ATP-binding protein [Clostridium sp.]|jgi:ABC-2 type transport system ATP-binding protein|uniref:ABC transporter ATP-binding protein n=1 Tax=Clostridium sp. TaxID=1506 RepID=UPI002584ECB0|nr:ABC transporter ATP-binding protein [Clostridium sp.]MDF2502799.1 ABC-type transport system, ATPase component [Clostridium sp.]